MGRAGLDVEVVRAGLERTEEHVVGYVFQEADHLLVPLKSKDIQLSRAQIHNSWKINLTPAPTPCSSWA